MSVRRRGGGWGVGVVTLALWGAGCAMGAGAPGGPSRMEAVEAGRGLSPAAQRLAERPDRIRVRAGDTLFALTERYQVSLRAVIEANDLPAPFTLMAGQSLRLPPPNTYRVQRGDTLQMVAYAHRVDPRSLALMNGLPRDIRLRSGDVLVLPALARDWRQDSVQAPQAVTHAAPSGPETLSGPSRPRAAAPAFVWPLEEIGALAPRAETPRALSAALTIAAQAGEPVRAVRDGVVVYAGDGLRGYGNLLLIQHDDDWVSAYGHARALWVGEGERVRRGDLVAEVGQTGLAPRAQLHFELRRGGRPVDPLQILPARDL